MEVCEVQDILTFSKFVAAGSLRTSKEELGIHEKRGGLLFRVS
jgi:hypothetical protein